MRPAHLLLLSLAAAAAIGAAILLAPDRTAPPAMDQPVAAFPGIAARLPEAALIEIIRHDGRTTLRRDAEGRWRIEERGGYPARAERVRELLVGLAELRLTEPRTANPELFSRLGLEDPLQPGASGVLLRVGDAAGISIAELVIGRRRLRTSGNLPESAYVRRPTENQSWLAEGRIPADHDPELWLPREIAHLPRERFREAHITRADERFTIRRGGDPDGELSLDPLPEGRQADPERLLAVARAFEVLTLTDVRAEAEVRGEPAGEARFLFTDGLTIHLRLLREGEALWLLPRAEGEGEEAATLQARWRGFAYRIGAWQQEAFAPDLASLLRDPPPDARVRE
jgi:hypothetical protein